MLLASTQKRNVGKFLLDMIVEDQFTLGWFTKFLMTCDEECEWIPWTSAAAPERRITM